MSSTPARDRAEEVARETISKWVDPFGITPDEEHEITGAIANALRTFHEWQPIETAPKDGSRILLFTQWEGDDIVPEPFTKVQVGRWDEGVNNPLFYREPSWETEMIGNAISWMPLPAPPKEDGK